MSSYRLSVGEQRVVWGTLIEPAVRADVDFGRSVTPSAYKGLWEWDIPNGVYTARGIVRELGVLLEAVCVQLGEAVNLEALLVNLEKTLAITGRETALPLGALELHDPGRSELSAHAGLIGETLSRWAREFAGEERCLRGLSREVLGRLVFRSQCDHHLWTHEVTDMLTGPAGGTSVMQLFNEYLHQMVLLRDGLLPFQNWQEVPLELTARQARGLRYTEQSHEAFLSSFLARQLDHQLLVDYAASLLAPGLPSGGYGFQYRQGTILPASLGSALAEAPRYLLRWYPVRTIASVDRDVIGFAYEYPDYTMAPRSLLGSSETVDSAEDEDWSSIVEARLRPSWVNDHQAVIPFILRSHSGNEKYAVDLGQIFRGHRFHYRTSAAAKQSATVSATKEKSEIVHHRAGRILFLSGLVASEAGTHVIETGGNELVARALLGKLYPQNIVLLEHGDAEELEQAKYAGKGFGAKFVLHPGQD
ncbi:hypothetical protein [Paenibacillus xylaniclasticus]|uniref:hypothetical protein n=1 Tax=Paenibacillus xylaniclasticus TaxID=588083 RepID=UPI000FD6D221|nr:MULTISPECIES: hypothetical protein [Paenibacillus]GFN34119.1 hypothetical protein PCURB6_43790 [Paenibacillus curdlanolyticus]